MSNASTKKNNNNSGGSFFGSANAGLFGRSNNNNASKKNNNNSINSNNSKNNSNNSRDRPVNNRSLVTIVTSVVLLIVLIIVIVYSVYRFRQSNLESVVLLESPTKLYGMTEAKKISGRDISSAGIGQEFSYSLWLYLVDYDDTSSDPRMIMMRNDEEDTLEGANPIIFMDGRTNRLYVSARTNVSDRDVNDLSELVPDEYKGSSSENKHFLTATVEYIPLQRWVNVVVVFQDNLMTVYLDGEMYTVRNVHDLWNRNQEANRPILSGSQGDVYIGPTSQNSDTVRGFISGIKYFNYALMTDAISGLYTQGPNQKSLMSRFGFSNKYGFQSPIYKMGDE